jgi:hypothetical protein
VEPEIACSLPSDETTDRISEWRELLRERVTEVGREGTVARLRLRDDDESLLIAADLARREKACCAFFGFHLSLLPEAIWLEVEAPPEASQILDGLVSLRSTE